MYNTAPAESAFDRCVPMKLINALSSAYGRKVAIALREKGIAHEVQFDVPWGEATCTPLYSPLEQLPILILDSGETVYDSSFILDWLELRYPDPPLMPADCDGIIAQKLLKMLGERVMESVHSITFELQRREPSNPWVERQNRKIRRGLAEIDRLVGSHRPADSDPITLGEITIGASVLLFEFIVAHRFVPDLDVLKWRGRYQNLTGLLELLDERPSFRETRPALMDVDLAAVMAASTP